MEQDLAVVLANHGSGIGIDLGGAQPIVLSDRTIMGMPRVEKEEKSVRARNACWRGA